MYLTRFGLISCSGPNAGLAQRVRDNALHLEPRLTAGYISGVVQLGSRTILDHAQWEARRGAHYERVKAWTVPHRERSRRGEKHPVWDFLFEYYAFRTSWLERWHPGPDVRLTGEAAEAFLRWPAYHSVDGGVELNLATMSEPRRTFVAWLRQLLEGIQSRPAFFGCHGLHEWAMVYRLPAEEVRHARYPLRLSPEALAHVVEALPIRCTHFDAFRFFTAAARPLNRLQPDRAAVPELEQRGCLHANMDLYKWAFKLAPYAPSELIADAFALARDIREVDMRASPYDFSALGFAPIAIETSEGRAEYERWQREFEGRAVPVRERLLELCGRLLDGAADRTNALGTTRST